MPEKQIATIQIDLDGVWAIRRCYGLEGVPDDADAIYAEGVGRFQELLGELGIPATFFVVGMDTEVGWKVEKLRGLVAAGHELGNHSYTHALDLALRDGAEQEAEISLAHKRIFQTTGFHCRGFKAPGYALSAELLALLDSRGYLYDASLFPSNWGWLMRGLTRWIGRGKGSPIQYSASKQVPIQQAPFVAGEFRGLVEMPVAVSPRLGLPFHCGVAMTLGRRYFHSCLRNYRAGGLPLNYTLHGVDLCAVDSRLLTGSRRGAWFFDHSPDKRREFVKDCLNQLQREYRILPVMAAVELLRPELRPARQSE